MTLDLYYKKKKTTDESKSQANSSGFEEECRRKVLHVIHKKHFLKAWISFGRTHRIPPDVLHACDRMYYQPETKFLTDVGFFGKTHVYNEHTRLKAIGSTWGRHTTHCVMFAEQSGFNNFTQQYMQLTPIDMGSWSNRTVRGGINARGGRSMVLTCQTQAFAIHPTLRWYYFHDDDTFPVLHRLYALTLWYEFQLNPLKRPFWIGDGASTSGHEKLRGIYMDQPDMMTFSAARYLAGGPGMLFSHALMKYMHSRWMQCPPHDDDDAVYGWCLTHHGLGAKMIHAKAFRCERFKLDCWDQLRNMTKEEVVRQAGHRIAFHSIYNLDEGRLLYRNFNNNVPKSSTVFV